MVIVVVAASIGETPSVHSATLFRRLAVDHTIQAVPETTQQPMGMLKLRKRLDLARDAERAVDGVPGLIVANWVERTL